jgi:NAD(P)-dependent dehydrogenase (short-subunit alcohol dehydrogenase family)
LSGEQFPAQRQEYPGSTREMDPEPHDEMRRYRGAGHLEGRRALITGGDSGIGRATAIAFAKEGADVAIAYLSEHDDARHTCACIEAAGRRAVAIPGDLSQEAHCIESVERAAGELGGLDVLVNNIAYQQPVESVEEITTEQWERTFRTNVFSFFWCTKAALAHLPDGGAIVNTSSINGLRGNKTLIDYSATKGAVNALTQSLAQALQERGIRVNAVAPGPVWTPLIPASMPPERVQEFGQDTLLGRPAQPAELAPAFVYLASQDASYVTGERLGVTGSAALP